MDLIRTDMARSILQAFNVISLLCFYRDYNSDLNVFHDNQFFPEILLILSLKCLCKHNLKENYSYSTVLSLHQLMLNPLPKKT